MNFDFSCDFAYIIRDVPHQVWEIQSFSGWGSQFLVRLLHNKFGFYANNFLRCYLNYLSPEFLLRQYGLIIMLLVYAGFILLLNQKTNRKWIFLITILPLLPMVSFFGGNNIRSLAFTAGIALIAFLGIKEIIRELSKLKMIKFKNLIRR